MKKKIILLLSLGLVLSACGKKGEESKVDDNKSIESISVSEEERPSQEEKSSDEASLSQNTEKPEDQKDPKAEEESGEKDASLVAVDKPKNAQNEDGSKYSLMEDGVYSSGLLESKGGDVDENGNVSVTSVSIDGELLIVEGSFKLADDFMSESKETLEKGTYGFKTDQNTKYMRTGGTAEAEEMTPEDFISYAKDLKESGLGLVIEVKDGLVKSARISS